MNSRQHSQPLQRNFSLVSPRTADVLKKVLKSVDIYSGHNKYSDLKNVWAPSAHAKKNKVSQMLRCFTMGVILTFASMFIWLEYSRTHTQVRVVEVLQPVYIIDDSQLINYAADFNGAKILSSSAPYHAILSNLSSYNDVQLLISESVDPGSCWAFDGDKGYAEIKLALPIQVTKFTVKHRNTIKYTNAPQNFAVYGDSLMFNECVPLGSYSYQFSIDGDSRKTTQVFECNDPNCRFVVGSVRLEIYSNYGADATCVYNFGVHGEARD